MGLGPFPQARLDEAFDLAVGLGGLRLGAQMLDLEPAQSLGVPAGSEARSVVGHDAVDRDAMILEETQGVEQKAQAGGALLVWQDLRVGEARVVVDRQMQVFPATPRLLLWPVRSPVIR